MKILIKIMWSILFMSSAIAELPKGFVYVNDIDPTIIQNLRYITHENFIGEPMPGYKSPKLILTQKAALALSKVQKELLAEGFSLVIYDAYRPQKAVDNFVRWGMDGNDNKMKDKYYPRVDKADVFKLGYVAKKSEHTRGSAVDLTIISLKNKLKPTDKIIFSKRHLLNDTEIIYFDDGTVDMGSSYDLFDVASHQDSPVIAENHAKQRNYLREKMKKHGFDAYSEEWWHFTLKNEPYPSTYFDFDVE